MLDLLHIDKLRRGADGNNKDSPYYANYDESKANPYPYPDPLLLKNGKKVTSAKTWWNQRRPEIVEDFDREIYGRVPKNVPKVKWEVKNTTEGKNGDVDIVTKQLVGHVDNSSYPQVTVDIQTTLTVPKNAPGPVPVMILFGGGAGMPEAAVPRRWLRRQIQRRRMARVGAALELVDAAARRAGPAVDRKDPPRSSSFSPRAGATPTSHTGSVQADNGAGLMPGDHRPGQQGPAAQGRRLGRAAGVGLGRQPGAGLSRDGQGRERERGRPGGAFALGQGDDRGDGLRSAVRDRLRQLIG